MNHVALPELVGAPAPADCAAVREALLRVGFTIDGVLERIGAGPYAAIARHEWVPVRRAVRNASDPVATLVRLWILHEEVEEQLLLDALGAALPAAERIGLLGRSDGRVRATLDVRPYGEPDTDWYSVADIGSPRAPEHVLGIGGASLTLARVTPRNRVAKALDLGVGGGLQALHASRHADRLVISDTNPRALAIAQRTLALSGVDLERVEARLGSLYVPFEGEEFDLVMSNPPFVISARPVFIYRDAGMEGDALSRAVVSETAAHLAQGGWAAILANWLHLPGQTWQDRVQSWVDGAGCDAWIVQRDLQDPLEYVEHWLRDADEEREAAYDERYEQWLDGLGAAEGIGFGWIVLRRVDDVQPIIRVEESPSGSRLPIGEEAVDWMLRWRSHDIDAVGILGGRFAFPPGVTLTESVMITEGGTGTGPVSVGRPGSIGLDGWRSAIDVDPRLVAILAQSGESPSTLGELIDAEIEESADPEAADLLAHTLIAVRELFREGLLVRRGG